MIKMDVSYRVDVIGSRVWFSKLDEYGIDSIFKANGMVTVFYGKHPVEYDSRRNVYRFCPRPR